MPFPNGVTPAYEAYEAQRGKTFRRSTVVYQDEAKTTVLPWTGLTIRLVIDGWITLTVGEGLELPSPGEYRINLTPDQTEQAPADQLDFVVEAEESATEKVDVVRGIFTFTSD